MRGIGMKRVLISLKRQDSVHCRLVVCRGNAEGILLPDRAEVVSYDTIGLRVEKIAEQYWALWGSVSQSRRPARRATWFDASRLAS